MNDNMWTNIIGWVVFSIPVIELLTGVAIDTGSLIPRSEKPFRYWFSVISKIIVALTILNLEYLKQRYGL